MAATPNMDKKWGQGWQTTGSCVPTIVCCQFEHFRVVVSSQYVVFDKFKIKKIPCSLQVKNTLLRQEIRPI